MEIIVLVDFMERLVDFKEEFLAQPTGRRLQIK